MTLTISRELLRDLITAAAASPAAEICGLLMGDGSVDRIVPARNVAVDPGHMFEIDPVTLFAAIRAERAGQGRVIGYYHSHPLGPPTPSPRDHEQAFADGRIWLIIGEGRARAWRMTDCGKFNAIKIESPD